MGINIINKDLIVKYLSSGDPKYIYTLLSNSKEIVETATKYTLRNAGMDQNEFKKYIGLGYLGFWNNINQLEEDQVKNMSCLEYRGFVYRCVRNAINQELVKERKHKKRFVSFDNVEDEEVDFFDQINDKLDFDKKRKILIEIFSKLTDKQKRFVSLYFGFETGRTMSMEEIGEIEGCSRACVSESIAYALKKIEKNILKDETKMIVFEEELRGKSEPRRKLYSR